MDFNYDVAQKKHVAMIAELCAGQLAESRNPHSSYFTAQQWAACGEAGLLGLSIPQEYGGQGLGALSTAIAMHAFGLGCTDMGLVFAAAAHQFACAMPIAEFASTQVKREVLPKLASGEFIGSNAITEPEAGSDSSNLKTRAWPQADGSYRLSGHKSFAGNAPIADIFVTYATSNPEYGALGVSGFVVQRNTAGIRVSDPLAKVCLKSCPAGEVFFDDCQVPEANRLGEEGQGRQVFQSSMGWERACLFAGFLGMMERQLEQVIEHARTRRQFGKAIGDNQAVSHRIAQMKLRLESARLLLFRACWGMDQGDPGQLNIALSKLAISEGALASSIDAIRIFGGRGCLESFGIESMLRDSIGTTIFSGTTDMQHEIIARELKL
ncbi:MULTISPECIES: L-prolyl-[peptidyl-carrier protein] dehydrogenase [Pseudomonas]|uniref:L-prolyl-[peptidyl-carrier protein] dehydrogenase n=1 Tax=Pseudomonas piscis TaxID=2614538 RepID=A0ABY9NQ75_9PSED|nr:MULTISPECIES: L-prolyl-[peptidyl-carrier protein] dehydrogenase [Pseudomonas]POA53952.1 acyl-CoA dehydrogenase [Pseudomonas sp. FW507-12TSA]WMN20448.1 L-prolyl-[peptidyl-carrier protein] dehydrogenase [Pseudomonas piscis]